MYRFEVETWRYSLKLKFGVAIGSWSLKLESKVEWIQNFKFKFKLKFVVTVRSWSLKLKLKLEVGR